MRRHVAAVCCALLIVQGFPAGWAQETKPAEAKETAKGEPPKDAAAKPAETPEAPPIPAEQLDALVAPIALYPDPLLAQTLVASTYPLELVQLQQWMAKNKELKDKALSDAVAKQPWDPSIQSMAAFPEVIKRLSDDIQWTTDLGNAFLAQQSDVMDAVQRMRKKAKDKGTLESNEQQKVETQKVEDKTVIVIEPSNPEVIYVPSYSPTVVYGPPVYPYPPIYYPYYPPGAAFVSFSFGVMWGAAIWGGSCCGCGWGGNDVNINVDNNFNRNEINHNRGDGNRGDGNRGQGNRPSQGGASNKGGNKWSHNPSHRGGTPYSNKATANKYGGAARGDSLGSRQASARQQPSAGNRAATGGGAGARPSTGAGSPSGGGDRIGSREVGKSSSRSSGFSGGSGGYNRSSAGASSSRGASSMGGRSFGGGGGGRGGGGGGRR